jgi:hypothetical protein
MPRQIERYRMGTLFIEDYTLSSLSKLRSSAAALYVIEHIVSAT